MNKKRKIIYGILSFLIPFIVIYILLYFNGFFKDKSIIVGDAQAQYYPLFNYLKGILNGKNTIFYSFNKNLGGTMFGTYFYYLSSPLNLILALVKEEKITIFMTYLIIVKMSLCSLSMYLYMTYKNKTTNIIILIFSICYGLMGYNLNFFVNIMWLDVVIIAPIVMIGIDKIINKESTLLYSISLFISIVSNYYIAYMLCIFCVLYFIYEVLLRKISKDDIKKITKKFLKVSILTGLMCSFFLVPCIIESRNYLRSVELNEIIKFDINFFDIFSKSYIGTIKYADLLNYSSMNIYCSSIVIPLTFLYIMNSKIDKRERKLTIIFLIIMILPCFIYALNYIWHLFSIPYCYSYRYSFLLCFLLINIAYKSYKNININKIEILTYLAFSNIISLYFIIITYFSSYYETLNYKMIWLTLLMQSIYFYILKRNKKEKILFILILLELILNSNICFKSYLESPKEIYDYKIYDEILDKKNRTDFTFFNTGNDSIMMNYYGINHFLSTNNNRVMRLATQLSKKNEYTKENIYLYNEGQYIFDNIVGLKYILAQSKKDNYILKDTININDDEIFIYENQNSLGLGYIIKNECNNIEYDFKYDEKIYNCITNTDTKYYYEYDIKVKDNSYSTIIKNPHNFYIYYPNISEEEIEIDNLIRINKDFYYIKNDQKNYNLSFTSKNKLDEEKLKIYSFDYEKLKKDTEILKQEMLNYEIKNNKIEGIINTKGGILMITIPYEKGYIVKVDGKKTDYKEVLDTFIGIDVNEGKHSITIEYKQPYLIQGAFISIISLCIYIMDIKKKH